MKEIEILSYAKINLLLKITGVNKIGFHNLDMIMASVDIFDRLAITLRKDNEINLFCEGIEKEKNTAYKAAMLFKQKYDTCGFDINIIKGIPLQAGLGGSSADSAAVLYALKNLFKIEDNDCRDIAKMCGSDTLYMLSGGFARVTGTGNIVTLFDCSKTYNIVIAKPGQGVNSAESYKMYDKLNIGKIIEKTQKNEAENIITALNDKNYKALKENCVNDLYLSSSIILPKISELVELLYKSGAETAIMSGSGSACIGLYKSREICENACENIKSKGYYAVTSKTINKGIKISGGH